MIRTPDKFGSRGRTLPSNDSFVSKPRRIPAATESRASLHYEYTDCVSCNVITSRTEVFKCLASRSHTLAFRTTKTELMINICVDLFVCQKASCATHSNPALIRDRHGRLLKESSAPRCQPRKSASAEALPQQHPV